ncbi:hypothetical protein MBLNU459_g1242t1 [Dothideomycetes sp. NU459]
MLWSIVPRFALLASVALAVPSPQAAVTSTTAVPAPQSTACGDIVNSNYTIFFASDVYTCLTSVPFNADVATRFISYYNDTIQFQSTLAYLKNPPPSYQQLPVDFVDGLQKIQDKIDRGYYLNEYVFEAELQALIYSVHDAHVNLVGGILAAFSFGSPYDLVTVSVDGKQDPRVYLWDDIVEAQDSKATWTPSPILTINGENVVDYLTRFAALNSVGNLEPHADWNQLMESPAGDVQGILDTFGGGGTFYPGDNLTFARENGTTLETQWLAIYNSPGSTGPLETGGDFYNFFVLGLYPASYEPVDDSDSSIYTNDSSSGNISQKSWANTSDAYPVFADVYQTDLGVTRGGILTGYFLNDTSTAVLSVPSFDEYGDAIGTFSDTVSQFIAKAKAAGLQKVVIDLQQNGGGDIELAFDTFRQFFPTVHPFAGSRLRAQPMADILGSTTTGFWNEQPDDGYYYYGLSQDEWVATDRIDAQTGDNFSSWAEFYGPETYNNDNFTRAQQYNLSSFIFDVEAFDGWIPYGYSANPSNTTQPWPVEDIIVLTDGLCSSACSLFLEMMHHEAGVRTVAVGGRPSSGPMQAAAGTRGAAPYDAGSLDQDFAIASAISDDAAAALPVRNNSDFFYTFAGFNLRDQIRPNGTVPLQFLYDAANCRIYFTMANVYNYTRLWQDAASAIWNDTSLCVAGSTGYATAGNSTPSLSPPSGASDQSTAHYIMALDGQADALAIDFNVLAPGGGLPDSAIAARSAGTLQDCSTSGQSQCTNGGSCTKVTSSCKGKRDKTQLQTHSYCLTTCQLSAAAGSACASGTCQAKSQAVTQQNRARSFNSPVYDGVCVPAQGSSNLPCTGPAPSKAKGAAHSLPSIGSVFSG